ncbi:thioredoxin domain-containing protein [Deinococcus sp. HMF7620]|uniref:Thioredoxin domain-containing protein n=1 Tax=Deinococcus arboris TaxID=2682977 RepID=A0A7C9MBC0_9DEIO|nr:DsbA family protein [Deinococcus arboris]MVN89023.1 thioredoxin domain-containing protein [Deinococcus arboris]
MTRLQGNNSNRTVLVIGTLAAAALIGLAIFAVQGKPAAGAGLKGDFNLAGQPYNGQDSAPVNVVVVEDFKCPVCKSFEETVAPQLKDKYVDTGKIKQYTLVWPFLSEVARLNENDSKFAAQAAKCVYDQGGNGAFTSFKSILFRAQGPESQAWATKTRLKDLAGNVEGVDSAAFNTCLDTDATAARVDADEKQVNDAGVNATPTVFVNGAQVMTADGKQGSYAFADISRAIDAASK